MLEWYSHTKCHSIYAIKIKIKQSERIHRGKKLRNGHVTEWKSVVYSLLLACVITIIENVITTEKPNRETVEKPETICIKC